MEAILKREVITNKIICRLLGVFVFITCTSLGAFVRIPLPFTPVPLTLQTFFVLLSGAFLGSRLGALTQASYIFLGALGLPLFTLASSSALYLFGPTAGYLFGFVLASFFIGRFVRSAKNIYSVFTLFCIADFMLLASGSLWLKFLLGLSFQKAFLIGFLPFITGDMLKALAAAAVYSSLKIRLK